jgi:hypothetical protein
LQAQNGETNKIKDKVLNEQWERERRQREFNEKVEAANRTQQDQKKLRSASRRKPISSGDDNRRMWKPGEKFSVNIFKALSTNIRGFGMNIVKNAINRIIAPYPQMLPVFLSRDMARCEMSAIILTRNK